MQGGDGPKRLLGGRKYPAIERPDAVFDGNKSQSPIVGHQRAHGLAGEFDRLLFHGPGSLPRRLSDRRKAKNERTELYLQPRGKHSSAALVPEGE